MVDFFADPVWFLGFISVCVSLWIAALFWGFVCKIDPTPYPCTANRLSAASGALSEAPHIACGVAVRVVW